MLFPIRLSAEFQMRDNYRPVLGCRRVWTVSLHDKIDSQAQLAQTVLRTVDARIRAEWWLVLRHDGLLVVGDKGRIVSAAHELLELSHRTAGIVVENLHHVFLGVRYLMGRLLAVLRHVKRLLVMQEFQDVATLRCCHNWRGNNLVHCLVVARMGGVMDKSGTSRIDI